MREMWRVLKPGGRLLILDVMHAGEYASVLEEAGADDVTVTSHGFLWCLPTKSVGGEKKMRQLICLLVLAGMAG